MVSNIILVDSSYTSFYRFFATMRWYSLAHMEEYKKYKDDNTYDWSQNEIFIEKYKKMYLDSIVNLVTKNIYNDSKVIFCLDAPQSSLWRKELSQCYKGNRIDVSEKYNIKPVFKLTYSTLIPSLIKDNSNIFMISKPKMEADDIIALATRYIRYKKKRLGIYLVSGDNDFLQLGFERLYFADYKKKECFTLTKTEAKVALEQKIINGDCSDNIPSIFPKEEKLSNKIKKLIREDKNELIKYLNENKHAKEQYHHNKKMISFKYIPKDLRPPVYGDMKKILKK